MIDASAFKASHSWALSCWNQDSYATIDQPGRQAGQLCPCSRSR